MKLKSLETPVVVIGSIWFFLICLAWYAVPLEAKFPLKLEPQAKAFISVIALVLVIWGIVVASTAADYQGHLNGIFIILFGLAFPISGLARHTLARYSPYLEHCIQ
jgi:hypothetical protein